MTHKSSVLCILTVILGAFYQYAFADCFLHSPRGSNNRLKGENANRDNANRVFDSQNNAKGGYNVAEKIEQKSSKHWFYMKYYMSGPTVGKTILPIEWTNQHGCGHEDLNCNIVLQYKCQPTTVTCDQKHRIMRNGNTETTPTYTKSTQSTYASKEARVKHDAGNLDRVLNEPWEWYDKCTTRERNKGLFTADQQLQGNEAKFTRQNAQGTRHGYECPEERDYYPYWHPTDWKDIAVLANKETDCPYFRKESFNTNPKGECLELYKGTQRRRHASKHNNEKACKANGGKWVLFDNYLEIIPGKTKTQCHALGNKFTWGIPYRSEDIDQLFGEDEEKWKKCLVKLDKVDCSEAPRTRTNHLGNGKGIVPLTYKWTLPHFPSGQEQRCVIRIRYNISTNDYDPKKTFASSNNNKDVISNDPDVQVGKGNNNKVTYQLAINTAQFGRTFQDRSHLFKIIPRKDHFKNCIIHNVNVRGKRGNIVQAFPAVEYDFTPKHLEMKSSHCVHFQFAGSNRNPAGNAGEGRAQTDRNNFVAMKSPDISYPQEDTTGTLFDKATIVDAPNPVDFGLTKSGADIAVAMGTAGFYKRAQDVPQKPIKVNKCNAQQTEQLDCYSPSYNGLLLRLSPGKYYYMCTRNNNFTNRNQKASITVQ